MTAYIDEELKAMLADYILFVLVNTNLDKLSALKYTHNVYVQVLYPY